MSQAIDTLTDVTQPQPLLSTEFAHTDADGTPRELGEVFTRRWIVEFILDAVGYDEAADLTAMRAVEPACGSGAFLLPMVERLISSAERNRRPLDEARESIRAFDLNPESVDGVRTAVVDRLTAAGVTAGTAHDLAEEWIQQGDYLLEGDSAGSDVDFVVGNPPYVRIEAIPRTLQAVYRAACPTMKGRSDIYVGFIEQGLRSLKPGGVLGFICADRWMRNSYGAALREFVVDGFSVDLVIQMHDVDAFVDEVTAYPAIFTIRRGEQGTTTRATAGAQFDSTAAAALLADLATNDPVSTGRGYSLADSTGWTSAEEPWPDAGPDEVELLRRLERDFRPLEDEATGTKVGIGVATGADAVYIVDDPSVAEPSRLLPLAMAGDAEGSQAMWGGKYLVNPWNGDGLVDLGRFPKLRAYLAEHEDTVRGRYVAKKRPDQWYRTIDRVQPDLLKQRKLLIPDIRADALPVLDDGSMYPHHNLYVITSDEWNLEVLGGLLLSDIAGLFVRAYSVKMRGGYLRFQAQNLRRIRVPSPRDLDRELARSLSKAFRAGNREAASQAVRKVYRLPG